MTVITFFIILILLLISQFIIKHSLTKKFQLSKKPGKGRFINTRHQKIDMFLTFAFLALFLLFTLTDLVQTDMFDIASPYILFPILFIIMELVRAWFQWKKSNEPKRAYLTLMNVSILIVLIIFYYLYIIFYL